MPGATFRQLFELWNERQRQDEYLGTLINAWLSRGGEAHAYRDGESYVDIGTLHGYRAAINLLSDGIHRSAEPTFSRRPDSLEQSAAPRPALSCKPPTLAPIPSQNS
jgi:hypothetical protein